MIEIKLSNDEYACLCQAPFFSKKIHDLFSSDLQQMDVYCLKISEEQADEIRDSCGEQLQLVGFDREYKLTPEGEILESLIDKFFV